MPQFRKSIHVRTKFPTGSWTPQKACADAAGSTACNDPHLQAHVFAIVNQPIKPCCPCRVARGPALSSLKWVHLNYHFADPPKENKTTVHGKPCGFSLLSSFPELFWQTQTLGKSNGWQASYTPHHNHISFQQMRLCESIRTNQKWMAKLWTLCHQTITTLLDCLSDGVSKNTFIFGKFHVELANGRNQ